VDVIASARDEEPGAEPTNKRPSSKELRGDGRLMGLMRTAIASASDDEGWAPLGAVGSHIAKQAPDFDPRNWRYAKLVDLVTAIGAFDVERSGQSVRVREKPTRRR
jgi:Fe-S-cluster formation regulator IscX/YfhJ